MSEYSAKSLREKMKAKARALAGEKDQKTDSSDWTPAKPLNASVKTGARPIMKPSSKGVGESNAARDTKAAIGNPKRGAYKSGGAVKDAGVKDKKALGAIDPSPKRGPAGHYKKGGKVKKEEGGGLASKLNELTGYKSPAKKQEEGMPDPSKNVSVDYRKMKSDTDRLDRMSSPYKKGGRAERKAGGRTRAKGKTNINIVIAAGRKAGPEAPALDMAAGMPSAGANIPVPMPGAGAPPPAALPMGGPPGAPTPGIPGMPPGRKAGGRITKVASSYKDMQAGAASGEGRLQKTDIAKRHADAPARKRGGKVYSSYKDMDAGAGSGPGRLEKTEIEKKQRARGK